MLSTAPRFSTLKLGQGKFVDELNSATGDSLLNSLTGEVLKVSYIRQIKADRLGALAWLLFAASALFIMLVTAQSLAPKISGPQKVQIEGTVDVHDKAADQTTATGAAGKNRAQTHTPRRTGAQVPSKKPN